MARRPPVTVALALLLGLASGMALAAVDPPNILAPTDDISPRTGLRYRLRPAVRGAGCNGHSFLSSAFCHLPSHWQKLELAAKFFSYTYWDVKLVAGTTPATDGSVLGLPVTIAGFGRQAADPPCAAALGVLDTTVVLGDTAQQWVIERVSGRGATARFTLKAVGRTSKCGPLYLGIAKNCGGEPGLYCLSDTKAVTSWDLIPLIEPCKNLDAVCTGTLQKSDCCDGLLCAPTASGSSRVCSAAPDAPSTEDVKFSTSSDGTVSMTLRWAPPSNKGASKVAIIGFSVVATATDGSTLTLNTDKPTATFTGLKVCGKTWTFVLKAKNGAGLWSGDSAPTEPYAAAPCPLRCLPKSATCQPAGRRRLFGALECCNSLKCVATQPPTKTVPPFVCASKPSAPLDIIVTPDQSNANTVVIQLQPPQDAGAQGIDLNSLTYEVVGKATDGTKVTQTVYAVQSSLTDASLCGRTWNFKARAANAGQVWGPWSAEVPFVAPPCAPTCKANGQSCSVNKRRRGLTFFVQGDCCAGMACISQQGDAICVYT